MTRVDLTFGCPNTIVCSRSIELPGPPYVGQVLRGLLGRNIGLQVTSVEAHDGRWVADVVPRIQDVMPPEVLKGFVERDGWAAFVIDATVDEYDEITMITPNDDAILDTVEDIPTVDLIRGIPAVNDTGDILP